MRQISRRGGVEGQRTHLGFSDLQVRHRYYYVGMCYSMSVHVLCSVLLALTEPLAALDGMSRLLARLLHLVGSLFVGSLNL
jgi:hypothetical protein